MSESFMNEHQHSIESLTWFVNGTLDVREHARVQQHLEQCTDCRNELTRQQQVRNAISQPSKVEFAPQTSFNKLRERIDGETSLDTVTNATSPAIPAAHRPSPLRRHWLPLAFAAQWLVIVGLAGTLWWNNRSTDAVYRTVTTTAHGDQPIIHAVFDEATRLSDVKDILGRAGLEVVAGPTAAGVYALTPERPHDVSALKQLVATLRNDPRVRFVELSHP